MRNDHVLHAVERCPCSDGKSRPIEVYYTGAAPAAAADGHAAVTVGGRVNAKPKPVLLFFSGGGFLDIAAHQGRFISRSFLREAAQAGFVVVLMHYRMTQAPFVLVAPLAGAVGGALAAAGSWLARRLGAGSRASAAESAAGGALAGVLAFALARRLQGPPHQHPAQVLDGASALHWTHDNIARYGGDPHLVVTAGHSAGGILAASLALNDDLCSEPAHHHTIRGCMLFSAVCTYAPILREPALPFGYLGRMLLLDAQFERIVNSGADDIERELERQLPHFHGSKNPHIPFLVVRSSSEFFGIGGINRIAEECLGHSVWSRVLQTADRKVFFDTISDAWNHHFSMLAWAGRFLDTNHPFWREVLRVRDVEESVVA